MPIDLPTLSSTSEVGTKDGSKESKGDKKAEEAENIESNRTKNISKISKKTIAITLDIASSSMPTSRDSTSNN